MADPYSTLAQWYGAPTPDQPTMPWPAERGPEQGLRAERFGDSWGAEGRSCGRGIKELVHGKTKDTIDSILGSLVMGAPIAAMARGGFRLPKALGGPVSIYDPAGKLLRIVHPEAEEQALGSLSPAPVGAPKPGLNIPIPQPPQGGPWIPVPPDSELRSEKFGEQMMKFAEPGERVARRVGLSPADAFETAVDTITKQWEQAIGGKPLPTVRAPGDDPLRAQVLRAIKDASIDRQRRATKYQKTFPADATTLEGLANRSELPSRPTPPRQVLFDTPLSPAPYDANLAMGRNSKGSDPSNWMAQKDIPVPTITGLNELYDELPSDKMRRVMEYLAKKTPPGKMAEDIAPEGATIRTSDIESGKKQVQRFRALAKDRGWKTGNAIDPTMDYEGK